MKYFKIIVSFIALGTVLIGCKKDFLQRTPLDAISAPDYFKNPDDLKTYVNQFYNSTMFPQYGNWGSDAGTDNQINVSINTRLEGTWTITTGRNGELDEAFRNVRRINYFFANYKKVEEKNALATYKQYLGEAYFFRALTYFTLLKSFGDIQWITADLQTNSPALYKPRDPRNVVADNIILALDSAAMYLAVDKTNGAARVNKWMALLIQSRVALYEGTWEKYHAGDPFGVASPDPDKYFNKAVEAADKIMVSNIYDTYNTGKPLSDYKDLFSQQLQEYATNKEVMFWRKYDNTLIKGDPNFVNDRNIRMEAPVGNTITKQLADSYLASDGKPITGNPLFQGYSTVKTEGQNRDPRFFQTIASPDDIWKHTNGSLIKYWAEVYARLNSNPDHNAPTGYLIMKGYNPNTIYHVQQFEETPSIIYRYAEALLNFAEAKAELGTITQADIDRSIKKLRDRVGMPNLILTTITADPAWDFPALSPIINEIRRERRVELALEGFRLPDIMRWAAADELIVGKRPKGFRAAQLTTNPFPVDANGFLDPFKNISPSGYGFKVGRDYLYSIPLSEIVLNPDVLKQNPGW
jgi:hypothetical protein